MFEKKYCMRFQTQNREKSIKCIGGEKLYLAKICGNDGRIQLYKCNKIKKSSKFSFKYIEISYWSGQTIFVTNVTIDEGLNFQNTYLGVNINRLAYVKV